LNKERFINKQNKEAENELYSDIDLQFGTLGLSKEKQRDLEKKEKL